MKRTLERRIVYIASGWQIITGAITVGLYLFNLDITLGASPMTSMFGTFIFTYGMAYVTLGIINIILTHKIVEDNSIQKNMPFFWIILTFIFLMLADYISLTFLILAITVTLAKNKPINLKKSDNNIW